MLRDRDGGLWIGTLTTALFMYTTAGQMCFAQSDGLSSENVSTLFEDREGNIWVATNEGLDRFREFAVATFSANQGLSNAYVSSVLADKNGSVWLATFGGLNRWQNGQIITFDKRDGKLNRVNPHSLFPGCSRSYLGLHVARIRLPGE